MRATFLLALLLACGTARASEWVSLGQSDNGETQYLVDASSIRAAGTTRRAVFRIAFAPHTMRNTVGPGVSRWWRESLERWAFDCGRKTARLEAQTVYYIDGTKGAAPERFPKPWEPVPPDTAISGEMQYVCAWKPQ
jgi:hypothetical protein